MLLSEYNATTPQSKVVEKAFKAIATHNFNTIASFLSKDFTLQTFPKVADLPDEPISKFLERYGAVFSLMKEFEVCIQSQYPLRAHGLRSAIPSSIFTK